MGRKETVITRRAKKSEGPTSLAACQDKGFPGSARRGVLHVLVGIFHHDHRGVHHGSDGNGNARQAQDIGVDIETDIAE